MSCRSWPGSMAPAPACPHAAASCDRPVSGAAAPSATLPWRLQVLHTAPLTCNTPREMLKRSAHSPFHCRKDCLQKRAAQMTRTNGLAWSPSPYQYMAYTPPAPPPNAPQGRKNGEGGEETGQAERDEQREVTGQGRPRSPKTVQSAEGEGKVKRERIIVVVRSPCQENYHADAHPSAHKSVLESANPRMDSECASGCTWSTARATARLRDGRPPE